MGLLDDAIREHLDLKRARGADPAEIERLEREALGPVRREPTIGSARFEDVDDGLPEDFDEPAFDEEHLSDLEELGYHDSTAPHPQPLEHRDPELHGQLESEFDLEQDHLESEAEEPEPPRRRFLRRHRPAALSEPILPDPGFDEAPAGEAHAPIGEPHALEPDELSSPSAPPVPTPPHLQFENPPKRPRFTTDPPSESAAGDDAEPATGELRAAPEAPAPSPPHEAPEYEHFDEAPADGPDAQETTEFDVEKHLQEAPPEEDEDMLEETPDFLQDTPEHDRLWFEQRPPKDFDFNG